MKHGKAETKLEEDLEPVRTRLASLAQAGIAPSAVIFACLADKNPAEMAPHLRALATGPIIVPPIANNPRAVPPEELAALIGLNAVPASSLPEALERATCHMAERRPEVFAASSADSPLLLCGSLYLLADFYALRPDCLLPRSSPLADL